MKIRIVAGSLLLVGLAHAQSADTDAVVLKLQDEVAQLRGLPFKTPVPSGVQSKEQFAAFLDKEIDEQMPEAMNTHYGAIVQRLGLYRGKLANFRDTAKQVMSSQ